MPESKRLNHSICWAVSLLLSLGAIFIIGHKWQHVERAYAPSAVVVKNSTEVEQALRKGGTVDSQANGAVYQLPTGVFIQSMAFMSPSDLNLTGYLWQKYPADYPEEFKKGVVFPEEVDSSDTTLREVYRHKGVQDNTDYEVIGWYFDVTVRQSFDYTLYPLNYLTVWLRLWPEDFLNDDRIVFVPDFASYADPAGATFGLDEEIVHGEWEIDETFFSYKKVPYDTDFGFFTKVEKTYYKELFYNIGIQRKFINAFIINLVPLVVVALLLFSQIMTVSGDSELADRFGFNANGVIATCAALFFVVLLAHVQVRQKFAGSGLVYIEYFYLIMYLVILGTALNAYVFTKSRSQAKQLIKYHDNFIAKVAFWPIVLWMMAGVTWFKL